MRNYLLSLLRLPPAVHFYLFSEMLFGIGVGAAVILNFHYLELGFDTKVIGLAQACYSVAVAVFSYPAGIITDRLGSKFAMLLGSAIVTLSYAAIAYVTTPAMLYLVQIVLGIGFAFVIACEFPYIMSLCEREEDETTAYNMLIAAFTLMMSVGYILGTKLPAWLPEGHTAYQTTIFFIAFSFLIMLILRVFLPAKSRRKQEEHARQTEVKRPSWLAVPSRQVLVYVLYATAAGSLFSLLGPFENVILRERFSLSDDIVGYLFALNSFLLFLTTFFTPLIMTSPKRRLILYTAFALQLLFMLMLGTIGAIWLFSLVFIGKGTVGMLLNSFIDASMMKATPDAERGLHSGLRNLSRFIIGAGVNSIGGFLLASGDYRSIYYVAFVIVAAQVLIYLTLVRGHLRQDLQESF